MATMLVCSLQVLLSLQMGDLPVRFGVPLPARAVDAGLRLEGGGVLQWRRLPLPRAHGDLVWVELAIVPNAAAGRRVHVVAGGRGPDQDGRGPAFEREQIDDLVPDGRRRRITWRWCTGAIDTWERIEFTTPCTIAGEVFTVGEALTRWSTDALRRATPLLQLPRELLVAGGTLPAEGRIGEQARKRLAEVVHALPELDGLRGAGDHVRSGEVVTNNEFDTAFALLRYALAMRDERALAAARRAAGHLVDRDLDLRTGLPFRHGIGHRTGVPEAGHVWVRGLLCTALWTADDELLVTARNLARALGGFVPLGEGRLECARDYAWPLAELEAVLAVAPETAVERAADRLAASIARRFDAALGTFRFGEGELGGHAYLERAWITGGLVVPALQAHLRRRPNVQLQTHVDAVVEQLLVQLRKARRGLPTHWSWFRGRLVHEHRVCEVAAAALMLEGLPLVELRRIVSRGAFRSSLGDVPHRDDPDLATSFTLLARCDWVWR